MKESIQKKIERKASLVLLLAFIILFIFVISYINASSFSDSKSTSVSKIQYSNPFGGTYSNLMNGPGVRGSSGSSSSGEEFYDVAFIIPPAGCQPYVVRSDLLEEQNVPVFCQLVPLKVNPAININRIERISVTQKESNPYIAGVGFHPARAAISSGGKLTNNPTSDNIGYVVVVLKKQVNEKAMPNNVTVVLSANLEYGAENAFGIGQNEFYIPVMSDSDFENNYLDYSFYDGAGYLRAEEIDEDSAVVSIYGYDFQRVFSQRIEKGKTSGEFYLRSGLNLGGQGIKLTLKDITIPEAKATIKVNGNTFQVYKGQSFYNGKCRVINIQPLVAGSGVVKVQCGKNFVLEKKLNDVEIVVEGERKNLALGEEIELASSSGEAGKNNYYLVYSGQAKDAEASGPENTYAFIAEIPKQKVDDLSEKELQTALSEITKKIVSQVKSAGDKNGIGAISSASGVNLGKKTEDVKVIPLLSWDKEGKDEEDLKLQLKEVRFIDENIAPESGDYLEKAFNAYDEVLSYFKAEKKIDSSYSYGEAALWNKYILAEALGQNEKVMQVLSEIENQYPNSLYQGKTARSFIASKSILSSEGSGVYDDKNDLYLELISVDEPELGEASVSLHYYVGNELRGEKRTYYRGDKISSDVNKQITLMKFTEDTVYFNYSCKNNDGRIIKNTASGSKEVVIQDCDTRIVIDNIKYKKVANVQITPIVRGRARESNFTFSIGIEKRWLGMNLTPEEANKKIEELNKQIAKLRNITETLGKLIEANKIACMATSAIINAKNLFAGMSGEATARREVMSRWNKLCESVEFQKESGKAKNQEQCIANNYDKSIKPEIAAQKKYMDAYNDEEKAIRKANYKDAKTKVVDEDKAKRAMIDKINREFAGVQLINEDGKNIGGYVSKVLGRTEELSVDYNELSSLYVSLSMLKSAGSLNSRAKEQYQKDVYQKLRLIEERADNSLKSKESASSEFGTSVPSLGNDKTQNIPTDLALWKNVKAKYEFDNIDELKNLNENTMIKVYTYINKRYLAILQKNSGNILVVKDLYVVLEKDKQGKYILNKTTEADKDAFNFRFTESESSTSNKCLNCDHMKVFALEPYKGMPSLLPFDCENGWYVEVKQGLPGGFGLGTASAKSYFDSGALNSFYLCNVGKDGMMDGVGIDNNCIKFELSTGQPTMVPGYTDEKEAKALVTKAVNAVREAQRQLTSNPDQIKMAGCKDPLKVRAVEGESEGKCTDFMSPKDCQLIFNVCDPVVCPNSRCDLGGRMKVDDVIQSGIAGSLFLCLPNFIGIPGNEKTGVVVPICLTGLHAGLDGWAAILESYRDCINESVTTGKEVGICDEIHSVYLCDFFWRQAGPFVNSITKNVFLWMFGRGEHGGGEYLFVQDAWNNAENSMKYFQTNYAKNSKLAFGVKDLTSTVVAEVCKMPMSATYPSFDKMLEPESPVQFHAFFEEIAYTDATVPPKSQYKVFYHIYAGNDRGRYYQVYLKNAPSGIGYSGKDSVVVAQGYVGVGQRATETLDFLDNSGFRELCVRIDSVDKCGFKSVSTDALLNYAKDLAVKDQLNNPITSEKECIAGSASAGALLTPNIQQAGEEFINPELYNQGVNRVCSNKNPGLGTDESRWSDAGYCDDRNIRCWVDEQSVKKAIQSKGVENQTLAELEKMNLDNVIKEGNYLSDSQFNELFVKLKGVYDSLVEKIKSLGDSAAVIRDKSMSTLNTDVKELDDKLALSSQRAELWFYKATVYGRVAEALRNPKTDSEKTKDPKEPITITPDTELKQLVIQDSNLVSSIKLNLNQGKKINIAITTNQKYYVYLEDGNTDSIWEQGQFKKLSETRFDNLEKKLADLQDRFWIILSENKDVKDEVKFESNQIILYYAP